MYAVTNILKIEQANESTQHVDVILSSKEITEEAFVYSGTALEEAGQAFWSINSVRKIRINQLVLLQERQPDFRLCVEP